MRVALVCDWLTNVGGAEKVLLELHKMYPEAPIYTSQYSRKGMPWFDDADVRVGWMRIFPCKWRRFLGVLRALYFSHLDLSEYDVVISVTGAEGKMVCTKKRAQKHERHGGHSDCSTDSAKSQGARHISYCHVPTQYYWQMYDEYVKNPGFGVLNPLVRVCFKVLVGPLRRRDYEAAQNVDQFVTISEYAADLIRKYYKRESVVVHPPVEVDAFARMGVSEVKGLDFSERHTQGRGQNRASREPVRAGWNIRPEKSNLVVAGAKNLGNTHSVYYITTSRQVTWKRLDLAVKACVEMGRELVVVGEGPEHGELVRLAGGSELVKFLPLASKEELAGLLAGARGYIFPSLEPFGIAPVEALVAGCPVIAYGKGGALDYVEDGKNGVLFEKQSVKSLREAMGKFEKMKFDRDKVAKSAEKFSAERFAQQMGGIVDAKNI